MNKFSINATNLRWINGKKDDVEDLCLHGHVVANIGNEVYEYDATVSATALYLLKSITENHIIHNDIQILPCCGFAMWLKNDGTEDVFICGCPNGVDWSIIHEKGIIKLITETGSETLIMLDEYKKEVFKFADLIEDFYKSSTPKILPENDLDREGYIAFWKEWHRRRNS